MSRYETDTFASASVAAGSTLIVNRTIPKNVIDLTKIKATPSIGLGTQKIEIFKRDTCLPADLVYSTDDYLGTLVDPVEDNDGVIVERNEGFVAKYEDLDDTLELHVKITNNHTVAKTYDFVITYELPSIFVIKATTGDPASGDEGTFVINTFDNNIKVRADGSWRTLTSW